MITPPRRKSRRNSYQAMSILFGAFAATVVAVPTAGATPTTPSDPSQRLIRYDLTGTGVAEYVTYQANRGQLHATNVQLPWSMEYTGMVTSSVSNAMTAVSAHGVGPGSLTCTITINGKVVARNTATGDPARVVCENH